MDYIYVALFDGLPVAASDSIIKVEKQLAEYTKGIMIRYESYDPKWPDDLQGWYTYRSADGDEIEFKLYTVDYK